MMNSEYSEQIVRGEALFSDGRVREALSVFQSILAEDPTHTAALNDAAAAMWDLKRVGEAADVFEHVLQLDPSNEMAFFNLLDLLIEAQAADRAVEAYVKYARGIADSEQKALYKQAFERLVAGSDGDGAQERKAAAKKALRIAVICGPGTSFIRGIQDALAERHDVRKLHFTSNANLRAVQDAMDWADVTWFEWCDQVLIHASNNLRKTSAVVCRIHSYEVFTNMPSAVNWNFVDQIVFVADHIKDHFERTFDARRKSIVIPNGVDLDKLKFKRRSKSHNIAYLGYINFKKNPEMLLQCMAELVRHDAAYTLHIAGTFQDERYRLYFEKMIPELGLSDNVVFDGWVDDVDAWLEDKSYLVSTSVLESFGMGIAEAMAKGLKPVIHNWVGAEDIYPRKYLFNTAREFADLVLSDEFESAEYRAYIASRYALADQVGRIDAVVSDLADESAGSHALSSGPHSGGDGAHANGAHGKSVTVTASENLYDRPGKTVIVTGIPRSGTSLFSVLMNGIDNATCLNEILYDVDALPQQLAEIRRRIVHGEPIPNKYGRNGSLTTNTQEGDVDILERVVEGADIDVVIGSKINVPYLAHLSKLIKLGYKVVAIVRDPVFTIGSWASEKASVIPEAQVTDGNMNPRWASFPFESADRYERQAQIWDKLASLIWSYREYIKIYSYEDLTNDTSRVLTDFCAYTCLAVPEQDFGLRNMNDRGRYADVAAIESAVEKYCPVRKQFGYGGTSVRKVA